uniref:Uncharacterized protein n=1 Tax=Corvus moneduloides TaxID=1196302 RepID=A0A8U7P076_CORMO
MGANSSSISELPENQYLEKSAGAEPISENDLFCCLLALPLQQTGKRVLKELNFDTIFIEVISLKANQWFC